ncbi:MAG: TatD family hydrolase [Candidatus Thorarchaeota archaeon]
MDIPILDNHLHLDPKGAAEKAILDFHRAGGTHIILSHKPYSQAPINKAEDYNKSYEITLNLAERVRKETNVKVYVTLGPYPVELLWLSEKMPISDAKNILLAGMDLAGEHVKNGEAIALGEIGRPHFEVSSEIIKASNEILLHGLELARDLDCAAVLHTESTTPEVCLDLADIALKAGIAKERVVKHYSPPLVSPELNAGLFPSVLASEKNIIEAVSQGTRFLMETDFLDDPKRPGAVLGVKTVPKRTHKLLNDNVLTEEDVFTIHQKNPKKVYGIEFD